MLAVIIHARAVCIGKEKDVDRHRTWMAPQTLLAKVFICPTPTPFEDMLDTLEVGDETTFQGSRADA